MVSTPISVDATPDKVVIPLDGDPGSSLESQIEARDDDISNEDRLDDGVGKSEPDNLSAEDSKLENPFNVWL
jgi:hypothetical protein